MSYEIKKDVPIPPTRSGGKAPLYPWASLMTARMVNGQRVGDALIIPIPDGEVRHRMQNRVRASADQYCRYHRPDCTPVTRSTPTEVLVWLVPKQALSKNTGPKEA